jgi:hypothetical protein
VGICIVYHAWVYWTDSSNVLHVCSSSNVGCSGTHGLHCLFPSVMLYVCAWPAFRCRGWSTGCHVHMWHTCLGGSDPQLSAWCPAGAWVPHVQCAACISLWVSISCGLYFVHVCCCCCTCVSRLSSEGCLHASGDFGVHIFAGNSCLQSGVLLTNRGLECLHISKRVWCG